MEEIERRYDEVNIKIEKKGGLKEGIIMREKKIDMGMKIMVGWMVGK